MSFHIVLVEPEIPANTGNIARTCAATGTPLHLVRPLGFRTDDKTLKRAGLDYWHSVDVNYYDSFGELRAALADRRFFFATTKAQRLYTEFRYEDGDVFVFGKETKGLPPELIEANRETCIRMPMTDAVRSLNLSNSAAIVLFEGLRQNGFLGLT
ncbi:tRNA (uridine(34)/cytosine(34)/5-carboxymethylaminomethyluridine(34)-2'-O)-methyltransferase TrmL [Paenibacillus flagellatus]|uniref:Putative tRNA (cytidine(34)-2'-O)-methyltransferase n=1 Tax=Paenibacillus flagellatus TaxID=2211139 RepID=A0A2V5KCL4_9BACL|nr:tRNA (uridine(34)/cytosine(34)/5-carboxymethylaminomethyluridine(34)-2'-O)-methyltransferase TrmL [Paenibacillus flagellatus]PYI57355.1 tRNA (uridine(34)/cytosine(34)/5-carboxymethylaminomethyluridine(34)-2'-O)-methyltransferase TrmL [Paenibacillus flagellatus]